MVKVSTFDSDKIREYIVADPEILKRGIKYTKEVTPSVSDAVAKESAIRQAQEKCRDIWKNDSTGYISSEYIAYQEFAEKVRKGSFFNVEYVKRSAEKKDWALFFVCLFLGGLGVHRFMDGRIISGVIWLCTGGVFGFGWIVDLINIWNNNF